MSLGIFLKRKRPFRRYIKKKTNLPATESASRKQSKNVDIPPNLSAFVSVGMTPSLSPILLRFSDVDAGSSIFWGFSANTEKKKNIQTRRSKITNDFEDYWTQYKLLLRVSTSREPWIILLFRRTVLYVYYVRFWKREPV